MSEKQRGLGRGLSALLGDQPLETYRPSEQSVEKTQHGVQKMPIELIKPNFSQPRRHFDEGELQSLAHSIAEKGIIQPILVRQDLDHHGQYIIIAGERRWRAAQMASLKEVPVWVRETDDLDHIELSIIENVQRVDLNPIEEAMAYRTLINRYNRNQEEIAKAVGKSRSHIANLMRLLTLPDCVVTHISAGSLSFGHARALVGHEEAEQLAQIIIDKGLSVRQTEELVKQPVKNHSVNLPVRKSSDTLELEQRLRQSLGLKVEVRDKQGKGQVVVNYQTLEQLDEIIKRFG